MIPVFYPTSSNSYSFIPIFTNTNSYSYSSPSSSYSYWEEERRRRRRREEEEERTRQQVNKDFNKDFEEFFKNQIKEIKDKITPDLFQIEPFYIEEMSNLINLITEEEKCEDNLFNEVKKLVSDNA